MEASVAVKLGGLVATTDLSASQYSLVKIASGKIVVCTAIGDKPIGVLVNKPKANEVCEIVTIGVAPVVAGATIAVGDAIGTSAAGAAVGETATAINCGIALSAGASGELVSVLLSCVNFIV